MDTEISDVSELLCVTGFVAKKTISHTDCKKCNAKLGSVGKPLELFVDEKSHNYFDLINRGGLTFPSNLLFIINNNNNNNNNNVFKVQYLQYNKIQVQWTV